MTNHTIAIIGIDPWSMLEARREAEGGIIAWLLGHTPSAVATAINYGLANREMEYDDARAIHSACTRTWAKHPRVIAEACITELDRVACWVDDDAPAAGLASSTWNLAKLLGMFDRRAASIDQLPDWRSDVVLDAVSSGIEASILLLRAIRRDTHSIESALRYARETAQLWNSNPALWPVKGAA
jgi:hypothetical protein